MYQPPPKSRVPYAAALKGQAPVKCALHCHAASMTLFQFLFRQHITRITHLTHILAHGVEINKCLNSFRPPRGSRLHANGEDEEEEEEEVEGLISACHARQNATSAERQLQRSFSGQQVTTAAATQHHLQVCFPLKVKS